MKEIFFKIISILIKSLIGFFVLLGLLHLWYNYNYCDVYPVINNMTIDYNNNLTANFEQLSYFFHKDGLFGNIEIPSNYYARCYFSINHNRIYNKTILYENITFYNIIIDYNNSIGYNGKI